MRLERVEAAVLEKPVEPDKLLDTIRPSCPAPT